MGESKNPFTDDENPYLATTLEATSDPVSVDGVEGIRRSHIAHEASVKSVGTLYILGCIMLSIASVGALALSNSGTYVVVLFGVFYLAMAAAQGITGYGLWQLKSWARWIAVAFSALGLLAIPIGTIISAYILYLLLSQKGNMVFSEPYQHIIAQTPHVKYKTSTVAWIVLFVFLVLIALGIIWALVGA